MKVLLDTDVVIDFYLNRQPFSNEATTIWEACRNGVIEGYVSAITPVNLFYFGRKALGLAKIQLAIQELLTDFKVCPVDYAVLEAARLSVITDYEDAVQHASAQASQLDFIVTRNLKDYTNASLPVLSPGDFLQQISAGGSTP